MKTCGKCKTSKPLSEFAKGKSTFGKHSWCKTCVSKNRTYAYRANPESRIKHALWSKYRLRPEDVERMLVEQNRKCIFCPTVFVNRKDYRIDHDHDTGRARGLLCHPCNTRLGWYETRSEDVNRYLK